MATYRFLETTVQLQQDGGARVKWVCDCEVFQRQNPHRETMWCEHITRAAALRSIERLTRWMA